MGTIRYPGVELAGALLLAWATCAAAEPATREIRHPTKFDAVSGGGEVVVIPSRMKTRRIGAGINVQAVGVLQTIVEGKGKKPTYRLQFTDGEKFSVRTGEDVKVDGVTYRGMGWQGDNYVVMNLKNRKVLRFRNETGIPRK